MRYISEIYFGYREKSCVEIRESFFLQIFQGSKFSRATLQIALDNNRALSSFLQRDRGPAMCWRLRDCGVERPKWRHFIAADVNYEAPDVNGRLVPRWYSGLFLSSQSSCFFFLSLLSSCACHDAAEMPRFRLRPLQTGAAGTYD